MKVFFNEPNSKASKLISSLVSVVDLQKTYHFSVVSCFLSDDVCDLLAFIHDLTREIHLSKFSLYIDSRQILKIGIEPLIDLSAQICREQGESWFEILAVDTPTLIHSKGFVLLSEDESSGALVVGSSNLSKHGFFDQLGNYESGLLTTDLNLAKDYLASIPRNYLKRLDELDVFDSVDSFTFQYALIREGLFMRPWHGTIEQYFAVQYRLTALGQQCVDRGELQALGFSDDVDRISRQYLSFEHILSSRELVELLNEGVETHLGHWIPKSLILNQENKKKIEQFYHDLSLSVQQQIIDHQQAIESNFEMLVAKGFIVGGQFPISQIQEKLKQLEHDDLKIEQLRSRMSIFIVPYNLTQTREIRGLFEEIRGALLLSETHSNVMSRVVNAIKQRKPSLVNLINLLDLKGL